MTTPSPSPQMPTPRNEWPQCKAAWEASHKAKEPVSVRHQHLHPFLQEALRSLAVRHSLLVEEVSLRVEIVQYLEQRGCLPNSHFLFRILLESALLRFIKYDSAANLSDLRDPMAPWHSFRVQVNSERRSYRRYLLAFLPEHGAVHPRGASSSRSPGLHWARLWDRLTVGIPEASLPAIWREVRASVKEVTREKFDFESDLVLSPRRDWSVWLAEPLFRAGAALEVRRPGAAHLILPAGLVPKEPAKFALDLEVRLQRFGGLPQSDSKLKDALEQISAWKTNGAQADASMVPADFLKLAEELGFSAVSSRALQSAIEVRGNRLPQARVLLEQSLSRCITPEQVGTVLGNISGLLAAEGDYETAFHYAQQALQYHPGSKVARFNLDKLVEFFHTGYNPGAQNHA